MPVTWTIRFARPAETEPQVRYRLAGEGAAIRRLLGITQAENVLQAVRRLDLDRAALLRRCEALTGELIETSAREERSRAVAVSVAAERDRVAGLHAETLRALSVVVVERDDALASARQLAHKSGVRGAEVLKLRAALEAATETSRRRSSAPTRAVVARREPAWSSWVAIGAILVLLALATAWGSL